MCEGRASAWSAVPGIASAPSSQAEQLHGSVLHQCSRCFHRDFGETLNNDSNGEPKHPRAGGGPEATPPGPGGTAGAAEAGPRQRLLTHTTATTTPGVHHGIRRRCASRSSRCMPGLVVPGIWRGSLGSHSLPPAATATHQSRPPPGD